MNNHSKFSIKNTYKIIALLAGVALLIMVVAESFWAFGKIKKAAEARTHTYEVIHRANALLSELRDAETGQRGYTMTGDDAFLEPYLEVRDRIIGHLEELRQLTSISATHKHLDALGPLIEDKMAEMRHVIELRRNHDMTAAITVVRNSQGKRIMDSIRSEMSSFIQIEESALKQLEAKFQSNMQSLFIVITTTGLLTLLFAISFAYLIYREQQHQLKHLVHLETQQLLEIQEDTNRELQQANLALQVSEGKLAVTLSSIGDGVMATDADGYVTLLNPIAEQLTGWTQAEAAGRPVEEIFRIVNQETRQPSTIPVKKVLAEGTIQGLPNHTILIARNDSERAIADSCAPIRNHDGQVIGAVLVFRDITESRQAEEKIRQMAYHDSLTGLPNRMLFSDRSGIALAQAQRNQKELGIAMLDLDHFKGVNDTLGHDVGDLLLKAAAERLSAALRKGDTVARFGGDEFLLILPDLEGIDDAIHVAQKIVDSFCEPFFIDTHQLIVTTSIGIAVYPNDGLDEGILLKNADIAMYQAKQAGRSRYQLCKKA
jgi:diguanylate cyclase (GGDEF)-like protein/PAS domain S-box-containing protein